MQLSCRVLAYLHSVLGSVANATEVGAVFNVCVPAHGIRSRRIQLSCPPFQYLDNLMKEPIN